MDIKLDPKGQNLVAKTAKHFGLSESGIWKAINCMLVAENKTDYDAAFVSALDDSGIIGINIGISAKIFDDEESDALKFIMFQFVQYMREQMGKEPEGNEAEKKHLDKLLDKIELSDLLDYFIEELSLITKIPAPLTEQMLKQLASIKRPKGIGKDNAYTLVLNEENESLQGIIATVKIYDEMETSTRQYITGLLQLIIRYINHSGTTDEDCREATEVMNKTLAKINEENYRIL